MLEQAYLIKGFLLAKDAPKEVMDALQGIITVQITAEPVADKRICVEIGDEDLPAGGEQAVEKNAEAPPPDAGRTSEQAKPRRTHNMSPEARAAAAERMRAMQARKREQRESSSVTAQVPTATELPATSAKPYAPVSVDKLLADHDGYAGKRDPGQGLTEEDWPDIKARLAKGSSIEGIAGDYDVGVAEINIFVASHERREARSPGEARASQPNQAGGAMRNPTW